MSFSGKKIKERFDYNFHVPASGLYAIFIAARCQSGEQIQKAGGEDLRVEIDGRTFREVPAAAKPQYQNIPVAWNGTKLKGKKQTVVFILYLEVGEHIVSFISKAGAVIEKEPQITLIQDTANITFGLEEQAEDGDRRPWFTFAFIDLPLQSFSIDATAKWRLGDSDDIKLIIDGEIQKNIWTIFHRNWLWAGSIFKKLLQTERKEKTFQKNLPQAVHYIELWADKTPTLHSAKFNLGSIDFYTQTKVVWKTTILREAPSTTAKELGDEIHKDEQVIILEKAVQGERITNPQGVLLSTNRWHRVKHQDREGYIYSMALEVAGEDKYAIQQTIITEAKAVGINAEILLALADCESNLFPYTVSFDEKSPEVAFGVMQLTKDLLTDLNDKSKPFYSPIDDVFNIQQNIRGGVRYFHYLYNSIYRDSKDRLRKAVAAYNTGYGNVPANQSLNLEEYAGQTKRIVLCVEDHLKNKTFQKILSGVKKAARIGLSLIALLFIYEEFAAPALEMVFDPYSAAASQQISSDIPDSAAQKIEKPTQFPAVILDKKEGQLSFFNRDGKLVKRLAVERLNQNYILEPPSGEAKLNLFPIRPAEIVESPANTFYFSVSASFLCRIHNCTHLLYRFNADQDEVSLIRGDFLGLPKLYLSPDASKLAIARDVSASICTVSSYLTVIDLTSFKKEEFNVIGRRDYYDVNEIESLIWQDNHKIIANIQRFDQSGCTTFKPKPLRQESQTITLL